MDDDNILNVLSDATVREELLQLSAENVEKMLADLDNKGGKPVNEVLSCYGESEEERRLINELCDEIDDYHGNVQRLRDAKLGDPSLTEGRWLEEQLTAEAEIISQYAEGRSLTEEERSRLKVLLQQSFMSETEMETQLLDREISAAESEASDAGIAHGSSTQSNGEEVMQ